MYTIPIGSKRNVQGGKGYKAQLRNVVSRLSMASNMS